MPHPFGPYNDRDRNPEAERMLRQRALELRSQALGASLGDVSQFDPPPQSRGKQIMGALLAHEIGFNPFAQEGPAPLPRVTEDQLRELNPNADEQLQQLNTAERFLLFAERPEALLEIMADSGDRFEQIFGGAPEISDPRLLQEYQLEKLRAPGNRGARLPRGEESLRRMEEVGALNWITDATNRAVLEAQAASQRGLLAPGVADARAGAALEQALLQPRETEQSILSGQASAASSRASAAEAAERTAQLRRGDLLIFTDPATGAQTPAYENTPEAAALRAARQIPFKPGTLSVQGAETGAVLGTPGKAEVQKAGAALRANAGLSTEISGLLADAAKSTRAFGPLADLARDNRGIALFDVASPRFADGVNTLLTGMDQEQFSQFRTRLDLFTTKMVAPITQEPSRYSDSERQMVTRVTGVEGGTSKSAYIGKLKASQALVWLNDDKLAVIGQAPGEEYGDLAKTPTGPSPAARALFRKMGDAGIYGEDAAELFRLIQSQRAELKSRGASLDGRLGSPGAQ